jgi:hypothetical protein
MIVSRVARFHYGMSLEVPYNYSSEQRFLGLDRMIWDSAEGRSFMKGRMEWMMKKVSLTKTGFVNILTDRNRAHE